MEIFQNWNSNYTIELELQKQHSPATETERPVKHNRIPKKNHIQERIQDAD
jgi:hypothetical protein